MPQDLEGPPPTGRREHPTPPNGGHPPYTLITADSHAGGSHAAYAEYLDPKYRERFEEWRGRYRNPFRDLGDARRLRNWDNEMRSSQQESDGVVGEVVFPNTVPPFFPSFVLFAPPPTPDDYELRLAGIRAHNRWLVDFCGLYPERRAGIGQIFLNDVDDALDEVRWIKEHGLRGGILLPPVPPDVSWIKPLNDPAYDPLWALCQELEVPVNVHGGTGAPTYPAQPSSPLIHFAEIPFHSRRPLLWMLLSGVFERFPGLRFVMTEQGCAWLPAFVEQLDGLARAVAKGSQGELRFSADQALRELPSTYVRRNVWVGSSQPTPADVAARRILGDGHYMWGSDYPHDEGTYPFTREHLRLAFAGVDEPELRGILAGNAASLYGFDLEALAPLAARVGPTVEELATPLGTLPEHPNEALLRAARTPAPALAL